jgi:hypothetical protein
LVPNLRKNLDEELDEFILVMDFFLSDMFFVFFCDEWGNSTLF